MSRDDSPRGESPGHGEGPPIPKTDTTVWVPLTPEGTARLKEKAAEQDCPASRLMRRGIDWITDLALEAPAEALREILEPSDLYPESPDGEGGYTVSLRPARMAGLLEATEAIVRAASEEAGAPEGKPSTWRPSLRKRLVRAAGRWATEELEPGRIRPGSSGTSEPAHRIFEKLPGEDRGGKQVTMAITKDAKEKLKQKAKEKSLEASDLARRGTREMIQLIEETPKLALKRIREESDLYQPPRTGGYQYGYQFYMRVETKRLLERARALLTRKAGRGRAATQREILQAAGRRVIEEA